MSRCLYQLGEDSYHLKLPPQVIAASPEPAGHAHSVLATTSPTQRGRPRERAPHMHTLTLLTASLKRGISMMNHRPALCVANTSESFLGNRPPRVPIMHEVNAAQGRNAETRASYRGETHPNSPETGVAWTRIPDSTTPCFPTPNSLREIRRAPLLPFRDDPWDFTFEGWSAELPH
jgi:hypothetical protein